jgi:hypothetical protein
MLQRFDICHFYIHKLFNYKKERDSSLINYLKQIPDEGNAGERRHPLWLILLLMILGIMSGYWRYRGLGRFVERHRLFSKE